jgi:transcriptional regulator with XRE-family HTH domain
MTDTRVLVKLLRSLRGWKQGELARAAGTTQKLISSYELGEKVPRQRTLQRLAAAVGVPFSIVGHMQTFIRLALAAIADPSPEGAAFADVSGAPERIARTITDEVMVAIAAVFAEAEGRPQTPE